MSNNVFYSGVATLDIWKKVKTGFDVKASGAWVGSWLGYGWKAEDQNESSRVSGTLTVTAKGIACGGNVFPFQSGGFGDVINVSTPTLHSDPPSKLVVLQLFTGNAMVEYSVVIQVDDPDRLLQAIERARLSGIGIQQQAPAPIPQETGRACNSCGRNNRAGARFCSSCGARMR